MIKEIEKKDIPRCVEVIRESFGTVAKELGFTQANASRFTAFAITTKRLNLQFNSGTGAMYAYYDNDKIIGYYSLLWQDNQECELNHLCVLPDCRHKNIGEALLYSAFDAAKHRNCKKMNISIVEENQVLRKWYERYGFIHLGTKKFDFFPFTCGYMVKQL